MINLFKQNEGFNASTFSSRSGELPDEIKDKIVKVEDEVYQNLKDRKLMWKKGVLVPNPAYEEYTKQKEKEAKIREIKMQIEQFKQLLSSSDYRAIKYAEGLYTEEEFAPYKAERQHYRDEINRLENELNSL